MTNDAKLGMLTGVLGVVVAAVLFAQQPAAPSPPPAPDASAADPTKEKATPAAEPSTAALPSTPVVRAQKNLDAQPVSRATGSDDEP